MPEIRLSKFQQIRLRTNIELVHYLIHKGAPLRINRPNKFDVSEIKLSEIDYLEPAQSFIDPKTLEFVFQWKE